MTLPTQIRCVLLFAILAFAGCASLAKAQYGGFDSYGSSYDYLSKYQVTDNFSQPMVHSPNELERFNSIYQINTVRSSDFGIAHSQVDLSRANLEMADPNSLSNGNVTYKDAYSQRNGVLLPEGNNSVLRSNIRPLMSSTAPLANAAVRPGNERRIDLSVGSAMDPKGNQGLPTGPKAWLPTDILTSRDSFEASSETMLFCEACILNERDHLQRSTLGAYTTPLTSVRRRRSVPLIAQVPAPTLSPGDTASDPPDSLLGFPRTLIGSLSNYSATSSTLRAKRKLALQPDATQQLRNRILQSPVRTAEARRQQMIRETLQTDGVNASSSNH